MIGIECILQSTTWTETDPYIQTSM